MPESSGAGVVTALSARLNGEVDARPGTRAMYGADASNYRRIPLAVVFPRDTEDIATAVSLCAETGTPLTMRGGGTSVAGNAIGPGIVVDTSRHVNRILEVDSEARTARVEPGVVLADLQRAVLPHGLRFGPDPSTISRCTVGGMIGNNACGNHSVAWGTTADNVHRLTVLTPSGTVLRPGEYSAEQWSRQLDLAGDEGDIYRELDRLEQANRGLWRQELAAFSRRVSGYGVDRLLPERGRSVAKALVGTEGTCGVVLDATVGLVQPPRHQILVVLGFSDDAGAADVVPVILSHGPLTVEGLDSELLAVAGASREGLPAGDAWLFVELGGDTADDARRRAEDMLRDLGRAWGAAESSLIVVDQRRRAALWRIRKDGAGLATRDAAGREAWPGWEDAAVPPANLGAYLRQFRSLLSNYGLRGLSYGHFGEGCIHVRINFDLLSAGGVARFRSFVEDAADLVVAHGGSLSGEHGDGLARSALLSRMYSPGVIRSFAEFARIFDPAGILNPGIVVDPPDIDQHLRYRSAGPIDLPAPRLHYPDDDGDLTRAVRRCVGIGKCRSGDGAVMCPSWLVTAEEKHSTRGRARILQEIVSGQAVPDGWRSEDAREALDLCLSCKGCASDCPVGVDMAVYKAEFLHQHYRRRIRPLAHYSLGWLPVLARIATHMPRIVNAVASSRLQPVLKRLGGIDRARAIPRFARRSFLSARPSASGGRPARRASGEAPTSAGSPTNTRKVVLWPDTLGNYLAPEVLHAGLRVLEAAGLEVHVPRGGVCCGLTWFSTGQLGMAASALRRSEKALDAPRSHGWPIVVLEPSCAAMLRSEATAVLGDTGFTRYLRSHVVTLAEALERFAPEWAPPSISAPATGQVHCHQSSVLGFEADQRLMAHAGIDPRGMQDGCCGLAGNFGFEDGHAQISAGIAGLKLLPAVESAPAGAVYVADGFSCRTQLAQLAGIRARHLAEVLAAHLPPGEG
ncbi:FAD-binding oxidoreductase [Phytoactinopolyspora alkaliphila]|uniref:FAD-binding oxidoreductase n=1 Tax=Phytoactinopolyspora alkaliphila TaxID=1783498 RepID=A0A6N9YNL6_9ACTN|nr:FAD-binding and (Fe-S)-binding domain-containing protein [Phytoactinopolyspora alkaliphila]NED96562.1 FAD-binding oxidoreductase [Phytoactinopolyspora alkaliphila]